MKRGGNQSWAICLIALACLFSFLFLSLASPLHKHDSTQAATCLVCHATERADVIPIHSDAGKSLLSFVGTIAVVAKEIVPPRFDAITRASRAPPLPDLYL